ncbi:core-binding factor subunit beta-like isoform X2 [Biomphalaria glabrata]|uniref:Core-binding factor subunit beta-like isoform X2 n=2 Tax=Biomphalaria TaxID=6525 RepID=A0A9W3AVA6_BIOGL|nr:core-binding factor subunit beta-like isoform X2 [Biomphalaria glabrata]
MNEDLSDSMLSFLVNTLYCELKARFLFAMPRVVPDQRATFENDELFRKLSRESEVRYTGYRDRPIDERQLRFHSDCREGHADLAFVCTGTNLQLNFSPNAWSERPEDRIPTSEFVNFDVEPGKVHLKSQFILNGVCVMWRGWVDLIRLDGVGCLEFDQERAMVEDAILREQLEENNRRVQEFEERRRQRLQEQERQAASEAEARSRRKGRPRKDVYGSNITNATNLTSSDQIACALRKCLEPVFVFPELKPPPSISEHLSRTFSHHQHHHHQHHRVKHKEIPQIVEDEEEDIEVDVEVVEDVVEVVAEVQVQPAAAVEAQPRDKIRKSDTIWSPWK